MLWGLFFFQFLFIYSWKIFPFCLDFAGFGVLLVEWSVKFSSSFYANLNSGWLDWYFSAMGFFFSEFYTFKVDEFSIVNDLWGLEGFVLIWILVLFTVWGFVLLDTELKSSPLFHYIVLVLHWKVLNFGNSSGSLFGLGFPFLVSVMVSSESLSGSAAPSPKQYGVTKPLSLAGATEADLQRNAELEKVVQFCSIVVWVDFNWSGIYIDFWILWWWVSFWGNQNCTRARKRRQGEKKYCGDLMR